MKNKLQARASAGLAVVLDENQIVTRARFWFGALTKSFAAINAPKAEKAAIGAKFGQEPSSNSNFFKFEFIGNVLKFRVVVFGGI